LQEFWAKHLDPASLRAPDTRGAHAGFLSGALARNGGEWFVGDGLTIAGEYLGAWRLPCGLVRMSQLCRKLAADPVSPLPPPFGHSRPGAVALFSQSWASLGVCVSVPARQTVNTKGKGKVSCPHGLTLPGVPCGFQACYAVLRECFCCSLPCPVPDIHVAVTLELLAEAFGERFFQQVGSCPAFWNPCYRAGVGTCSHAWTGCSARRAAACTVGFVVDRIRGQAW
jgi:hypothetical protein